MEYRHDKSGIRFSDPDCCDEWLFDIWAIGIDYDGATTVDELKRCIDNLVEMASKARSCLWEKKLFGVYGSPDMYF